MICNCLFARHFTIPSQAKPAFLIDGRTGNGIMSPLLALITRQL
jgi:hypothetical protein